MNKKKLIAILSVSLAVALIAAAVIYDALSGTKTYEKSGIAMGSLMTVTLYDSGDDTVAKEVIEEVQKVEKNYISKYIENSEIYTLNKTGNKQVSDFTKNVLLEALDVSSDSDGAFDITIGNLSALWDFDDDIETVPDDESIKNALITCDYTKIRQEGNRFSLGENQTVDLGAVGKGLGCDSAAEILNKNNVTGAIVDLGGTVLAYGENPSSNCWTIGIRTPDVSDSSSYFAKVKIYGNACISTSGSYEKCFTKNGKLYHHILSTETGYPAKSGLKSVTVISEKGILSDALSTACFVMGYEKACSLLNKYDAEGIFVTDDNTVIATDKVKNDLTLTDANYSFE